jgi:diguanylate cyclase (GGDEF)-like protein/putative nucleotidyltransferase with HDIG domain
MGSSTVPAAASKLFHGRARIFVAAVTIAGWGVVAFGLGGWQSKDVTFFCIYLYLALLATGLRIRRTFHAEAVPVQFLFVLAALKELSLSEVLLLAAASSLLEALSNSRTRLFAPDGWFHGAVMTLAASSAWLVHAQLTVNWPAVAAPLALMLAASVYFATSTLLISQATALRDKLSIKTIWQDVHLCSYPYYLVGATMASLLRITDRTINWAICLLALPVFYLLLRSYRVHVDRLHREKAKAEKMADVHLQTVEALASAVEAKDQLTHGHLLRVQVYSLELGKELNLSKEEMESLRAASILHDIGKVGVPERILGKPTRLTPEEFERVKLHTIIGAEITERVDFPYPVASIIRAHHERWDGRGYPDGLEGERIPIAARVLSVADFLDAITSDRQYRLAASAEDALAMVIAERGRAFDPRVVDALSRRYSEMVRLAWQRTSAPAPPKRAIMFPGRGEPARGYQPVEFHRIQEPPIASPSLLLKHEIHSTVELSEGLRDALSFNESLSVLAERLRGAIPFDTMALYVKDSEKLLPRFVVGENSRLLSQLEIPQGQGLCGWVADNGTPILNGDPSLDPGYLRKSEGCTPLRSILAIPLESGNGLLGVLSLYRQEEEAFTFEQLGMLREIGPSVSRAVDRALKLHQAEAAATTDYLTGLPNARSLMRHLANELSRSQREGSPLTVLICAMGIPGVIDDATSQANRSEALRSVSQILKAACRPYDYVARWDVSRFAVVLPGVNAETASVRSGELIRTTNETARVCYFDGRSIVTAGSASYPGDGADAATLLKLAERCMRPIAVLENDGDRNGQPASSLTPA